MRSLAHSTSTGRLLGVALGAILITACAREEPPDVVLIVVDTLRADHVGSYGYERATTPELDRFAADAIVFENVVSPAPWTLPAVASMFTSTYPTVHGLRSRHGPKVLKSMRAGLTTLAEAFAAAGYRTVAIGTNPWVDTEGNGLQKGFEDYRKTDYERAEQVNALAREVLGADDPRPVFLYLHYMDVHGPYNGHAGHTDLGPIAPRYVRKLTLAETVMISKYLVLEGVDTLDGYLDAYDGGIREWDRQFGEFASWLQTSGRLQGSIVAIVSDHGEEFLEHAGWNHGLTVFEEQIHVPWILRAPNRSAARVAEVTSLIDVAPTLLALADIAAPESMGGVNALAAGEPNESRPVFSETHIRKRGLLRRDGDSVVAMRRDDMKWIYDGKTRRCFDLSSDPGETRDAGCDREDFDEIEGFLSELKQRGASLGRLGKLQPSAEDQERLRALGYVE